ncbi:MAG: hypothetical protein KGZ56_06180 [Dethiobacter sp.]|nr:hypothetical protein [Dethiobacter sp.]MBS3898634.1 hypothetical protein [Dethiobacter sp.]
MPNHVHGIVVMVGFGIIVLVGGFQTRPHGESVRRERETVATKEHLCRRREGGF